MTQRYARRPTPSESTLRTAGDVWRGQCRQNAHQDGGGCLAQELLESEHYERSQQGSERGEEHHIQDVGVDIHDGPEYCCIRGMSGLSEVTTLPRPAVRG